MSSREHGTDRSTAGLSAERIGRNDAIFRSANEKIDKAAEHSHFGAAVPFICECADPHCRELVRMSREEYALIRGDPRRFLNVPGHEASSQGWGQVVEEHGTYIVEEKIGPAAEVAEQLEGEADPANAPAESDEPHTRGSGKG